MRQLLITIAAMLIVGCGEWQQSAPAPESKPVEPVAEAAKPEPPTAKAPDISIHDAANEGNIEGVKQHLAAGMDVDVKDESGETPLHFADNKEIADLLITSGADVNDADDGGATPLHKAAFQGYTEIAELLIANGADVNAKTMSGGRGGIMTPLDVATHPDNPGVPAELANLLRKHGGKTAKEFKAEGK